MSWLWLWTDILDSEKVAELDDSSFRGWVLFLACAKRHNNGGELPSLKKLVHWCRTPEPMVKNWLLTLAGAELLERRNDVFTVHDWEVWQPEHSWKTPAERSRAYRERKKAERHVESPSALPLEEKRREESIERDAYKSSRDALRDDSALTPATSSLPLWSPRQKECIDLATERWGASCGDVVVGDLLRNYPSDEDVVMDAMDSHWDSVQQAINPRLLRGICRGKFNDKHKLNGKKSR